MKTPRTKTFKLIKFLGVSSVNEIIWKAFSFLLENN